MKFLFAGGGTGGHLFSGIAVAEDYLGRESVPGRGGSRTVPTKNDILFVGTSYGLENTLIPQLGYRLELIPVKQLKGKGLFHRLKTLAQIPYAFWKSFQLLRREKPDLVLGIGGWRQSRHLMAVGIQTAIIEQNSYPGFTNRVLGKFVHRVFIAFENARKFFASEKTVLTGNPVRKSFFALSSPPPPRRQDRKQEPISSPPKGAAGRSPASSRNTLRETGTKEEPSAREPQPITLLILGGSQGAHSINQAMLDAMKFLSFSRRPKDGKKGSEGFEGLKIIHQTGKADLEWVRKAYAADGVDAQVMDFIRDIQNYYAQADLVIARAGAGTITELENMGKPALLIPYPYAADDHQRLNAEEVARGGGARVLLNQELTGKRLFEEIERFRKNPEMIQRMGENIHALAKPQAAQEIVKICEGLVLGS
jgi:UDP-N-acetylglucosamine--N-acetylmuramyl-(pentapeptide) pyrophosphoryl-undecaprenol N-acetylglucosamine transferase